MFNLYKHVLPRARAWRLTVDKPLTRFFKGLGSSAQNVRAAFDASLDDLYPQTTTKLPEWETQFGLPGTALGEQERRDRLAAAWQAQGGQDPEYIQATLRGAGFDVYVHDWWVPGTEPLVGVHACATPRSPSAALSGGGELLVNVIRVRAPVTMSDGAQPMQDGGVTAQDGGTFDAYALEEYEVPTDPATWPYFVYIGGATFPGLADVPAERREEFQALCLKIAPAQLWIAALVNYV